MNLFVNNNQLSRTQHRTITQCWQDIKESQAFINRRLGNNVVNALCNWAKEWELSISLKKYCLINIGQSVVNC